MCFNLWLFKIKKILPDKELTFSKFKKNIKKKTQQKLKCLFFLIKNYCAPGYQEKKKIIIRVIFFNGYPKLVIRTFQNFFERPMGHRIMHFFFFCIFYQKVQQ